MVNIGGDIRHIGPTRVEVAITDPRRSADNAPPLTRISILNQGLATSGRYQRGNHLIDPASGQPSLGYLGVSVIASSCTDADAFSTAASVMELQATLDLAERLGNVGVLVVDADGESHTNSFWNQASLN